MPRWLPAVLLAGGVDSLWCRIVAGDSRRPWEICNLVVSSTTVCPGLAVCYWENGNLVFPPLQSAWGLLFVIGRTSPGVLGGLVVADG